MANYKDSSTHVRSSLRGSYRRPEHLSDCSGYCPAPGPLPATRRRLTLRSLSLACLCTLSLGAIGCHHAEPADAPAIKDAAAKKQEPIKAKLSLVEEHSWPTIVRSQGSLVADDQTTVGSRVAGLVFETYVDVGDAVEPGQKLVALDDREFQLQLAAAEAALLQARALVGLKPGDPVAQLNPLNAPPVREARATLEETTNRRQRWELLRSQNGVTEEELQTLIAAEKVAEARYASALNSVNSNIAQIAVRSAEVELAKQHIRDSQIVAPFAGFIQQRFVAPGTFVQIGNPLVGIVRIDTLRFRGTVPERLATELEIGQTVRLAIESVAQPVDAKVTRISPALDMASRSLMFEATVDNHDGALRAGLFAQAEVAIDPAARAMVVNESSLVEFAGTQKVWKVVDGVATEQVVEPGRRSNGLVEIVTGLKSGDQILINGALGRAAKVVSDAGPERISPAALAAATGVRTQNDAGASEAVPPPGSKVTTVTTAANHPHAQASQATGAAANGTAATSTSASSPAATDSAPAASAPAASGTAGSEVQRPSTADASAQPARAPQVPNSPQSGDQNAG